MSNEFVSRSLDEIRFWSRIMKEHSPISELGLGKRIQRLIQEADHFHHTFEQIEGKSHPFNELTILKQITRFNIEVISCNTYLGFYKKGFGSHHPM